MFLAENTIQLVPDGTLLIHLLMIAVMVAVLNRTLLKPINKILQEREKNILGRTAEAHELLKAREERIQEYDSALRAARTDGYHLLEKERSHALKLKDEKVRSFKEELQAKVSAELKQSQDQEVQVRRELEGKAHEFGSLISSQILRR